MKRRRQNCDAMNYQAIVLVHEGRCSEAAAIFDEAPLCRKSAELQREHRFICGRPLSGKKRSHRRRRGK